MFVAVVAAALYILTAATGGSAADSCAISLSPLVGGEDECPAPGDDELVIQNVTALLEGVVCCMQLGHTPEYPANSCTELQGLKYLFFNTAQ